MQKSLEETKKSFFRLVELIKQGYILASELGVDCDRDFKIYFDGDMVGIECPNIIHKGAVVPKSKVKEIKGVFCVDILDCLAFDYVSNKKELAEAYKAINKLRADTEFYLAAEYSLATKELMEIDKNRLDFYHGLKDHLNKTPCNNKIEDKGFVYVVYNPKTKLTKIGKSMNPKSRIKSLAFGAGCDLKELAIVRVEDCSRVENMLHKKFNHARKVGEWFKLDIVEKEALIKELEGLSIEINKGD